MQIYKGDPLTALQNVICPKEEFVLINDFITHRKVKIGLGLERMFPPSTCYYLIIF